jgi:hypothetical protein
MVGHLVHTVNTEREKAAPLSIARTSLQTTPTPSYGHDRVRESQPVETRIRISHRRRLLTCTLDFPSSEEVSNLQSSEGLYAECLKTARRLTCPHRTDRSKRKIRQPDRNPTVFMRLLSSAGYVMGLLRQKLLSRTAA